MSAEKKNIHILGESESAPQEDTASMEESQATENGREATHRDMSRVAVIVSLLSVVLLVIFFFGLNRNIAGLNAEVKSLGALRGQVQEMDERLLKLEDVPAQMKRTAIYGLTTDMTMQSAYLEGQVENEAQKERLQAIQKLLDEFRSDLMK